MQATLISRARLAVAMALVFALCACAGTPSSTTPAETDELQATAPVGTTVIEPGPTQVDGNPTAADIGDGRPATITLVLSGTTFDADGSYEASGPARLCGNAQFNLTGSTTGFNFEFPQSSDAQINDVTFGATDLVPGSSTTDFHVGVNVTTSEGHEPPATVITADEPTSGDSGSAQLSESSGTLTLVVNGTNDFGETVTLTVTCGPRPG